MATAEARRGLRALPFLAGGGDERCGGVARCIIEVDFFDEADGELVVDEEDVVAGIDARGTVLSAEARNRS